MEGGRRIEKLEDQVGFEGQGARRDLEQGRRVT